MMSRFAVRSDQPEIMDDLMCSGQDVRQALHELEVINAWLGGNAVTLKGVAELVEDVRPEAEITVADLGCGGGDIAERMRSMLLSKGLKRSEEHTSELQSREKLVCRLPLEKKKHSTQRDRRR